MRNRLIGLFSVLAMIVVALPLTAQSLPDQAVQRLEAVINQTMREQKIPGFALGVVKDGRLVYSRGFGVMQVGQPDQPVSAQTLFHMAFITKPFVATSIMQLVEQGKLNLDAPVPQLPVGIGMSGSAGFSPIAAGKKSSCTAAGMMGSRCTSPSRLG